MLTTNPILQRHATFCDPNVIPTKNYRPTTRRKNALQILLLYCRNLSRESISDVVRLWFKLCNWSKSLAVWLASIGFYPPNLESKSGATPPSHFWAQARPFFFGFLVKCVDCPVKIRGKVLIYTFNKTFPPFFTGRKLRPPGIGI